MEIKNTIGASYNMFKTIFQKPIKKIFFKELISEIYFTFISFMLFYFTDVFVFFFCEVPYPEATFEDDVWGNIKCHTLSISPPRTSLSCVYSKHKHSKILVSRRSYLCVHLHVFD